MFVSSDSSGMFGAECPVCHGYWRSRHTSLVCPYCAFQSRGRFQFLTQAQRKYVEHYCSTLSGALESGEPGEYVIDMDAVADAAGKDSPKPAFYYAEEQQQNLFTCRACDGITDVLGTYAYCSLCATRNDLQELEERVRLIRERANTGGPVRGVRQRRGGGLRFSRESVCEAFMTRVPLTRGRLTQLQGARYHNLGPAAEAFKRIFDIDILERLDEADSSLRNAGISSPARLRAQGRRGG